MFKYCPVDVTSHRTASINVSRWHKCCASCNNVFYVLLFYSTSCISCSWCSSDDNTFWVLALGLLLLNSLFLHLGLDYITTPGNFLYLLMVFQGPLAELSNYQFHWVLLFSHFQCWPQVDSWYSGQQFLISYICFIKLASFAESVWLSWCHILALIW